MGAREKKQQVPPLRFAPVGMTILLQRSSISRWISFGHNRIVIPTGAKRSGGTCCFFPRAFVPLWQVKGGPRASPRMPCERPQP
jgi:hypothetical protein